MAVSLPNRVPRKCPLFASRYILNYLILSLDLPYPILHSVYSNLRHHDPRGRASRLIMDDGIGDAYTKRLIEPIFSGEFYPEEFYVYLACTRKKFKTLKYLLKIRRKPLHYGRYLTYAALSGDLKIFKYMLNFELDNFGAINIVQSMDSAIKANGLEIVKYIMEQYPEISRQGLNNRMYAAIEQNNTEIVKYLESLGARDFSRHLRTSILYQKNDMVDYFANKDVLSMHDATDLLLNGYFKHAIRLSCRLTYRLFIQQFKY